MSLASSLSSYSEGTIKWGVRAVRTYQIFKPKFCPLFSGSKKSFFGLFECWFGVVQNFKSCLGIVFGLRWATFRSIFSLKGRYMTSKIKFLRQNFALWEPPPPPHHPTTTTNTIKNLRFFLVFMATAGPQRRGIKSRKLVLSPKMIKIALSGGQKFN